MTNKTMNGNIPAEAIGKLREAVSVFRADSKKRDREEEKNAVLARFQPIFSREHVENITEDEFRSFLLIDNNRHWTGLHRQGPRMCSDMKKLRKALGILVDETKPVAERLDKATDMVSGMGKNVATAILIVTEPDLYGVWNNRSEANLKKFGIWPSFERGESFGNRYLKVNQVLLQLKEILQIDLWALDAFWWYLDEKYSDETLETDSIEPKDLETSIESSQRFGLERHLHEFIRDNWSRVELGKDWKIYQEPGDEEAGYEYPCDVGRIDLLAKHRNKPRWLVVELKRNQTNDKTVGQLLRYMGWVKQHLAETGEEVHGMIICREADSSLRYAISTLKNVEVRRYEVEFQLCEPEKLTFDSEGS